MILGLTFADLATHGETIGKIFVGLSAIGGAFIAVRKYVYQPFKKFIYKAFTEDRQKLDFIVSELKPNGGGSIKDQINLIRDSVIRTEIWQKTRLSHENLPYFDTDHYGRLVWVNKACMRLFNASENELLGYGIRNFIDHRDKGMFITEWEAAIKNCIDLKTNFRVKNSAGQIKCMEFNALAVRGGKENSVIGYTGVLIEKELGECN